MPGRRNKKTMVDFLIIATMALLAARFLHVLHLLVLDVRNVEKKLSALERDVRAMQGAPKVQAPGPVSAPPSQTTPRTTAKETGAGVFEWD
jgi:hypothetical protein